MEIDLIKANVIGFLVYSVSVIARHLQFFMEIVVSILGISL